MSLYEYAKSNPILLTDALGGCSKPKPKYGRCKCFCITNLTITGERHWTSEDPRVGANIDLIIQGEWINWSEKDLRKGKPSEAASIEWWEWFYPKPTRHEELYEGKTTKRWWPILQFQAPKSEKKTSFTMHDKPGVTFSEGTKTEVKDMIAVRAKNPKGCPCKQKSHWEDYAHVSYTGDRPGAALPVNVTDYYFALHWVEIPPTWQPW